MNESEILNRLEAASLLAGEKKEEELRVLFESALLVNDLLLAHKFAMKMDALSEAADLLDGISKLLKKGGADDSLAETIADELIGLAQAAEDPSDKAEYLRLSALLIFRVLNQLDRSLEVWGKAAEVARTGQTDSSSQTTVDSAKTLVQIVKDLCEAGAFVEAKNVASTIENDYFRKNALNAIPET